MLATLNRPIDSLRSSFIIIVKNSRDMPPTSLLTSFLKVTRRTLSGAVIALKAARDSASKFSRSTLISFEPAVTFGACLSILSFNQISFSCVGKFSNSLRLVLGLRFVKWRTLSIVRLA